MASLEGCERPDVTVENKGLTTPPAAACTSACTSKPEDAHESKPEAPGEAAAPSTIFEALAVLILQLPADDRARLAALLKAKDGTE